MKKILIYFLFVTIFFTNYSENKILKIDFQDTEPKYIKNSDGSFSGLCFELMKLIENNSEYKFIFPETFIPLQRILFNLKNNKTDLHLGFTKSFEREKIMIFGEPLYKISGKLASKKDDNIIIENIDDIKRLEEKGVILSISGVALNEHFRNLGLIVDESSRFVDQALLKLIYNRIGRFVLYHDLGLFYELGKDEFKDKFNVQPITLEEHYHWIVFSKQIPSETIDDISEIITQLKISGKWDKVLSKYGITQ